MLRSAEKLFASLFGNRTTGGNSFDSSHTCPECGSKLYAEAGSEYRRCPNLDCPAKVRERIEHWCCHEAMNIPLADKPLVAQLVKQGLVFNVAELYSLKLKEAAALEGRDSRFAHDLLDQIKASKSREAWRVLYGLSIPIVGVDAAKELCRHFAALDDILPAGPERLMTQAGVTEAVARSIAHWYGDGVNRRLVRRLQKVGVNFKT